MKHLLPLLLLFPASPLHAGIGAYRFLEVKSFSQESSLPPKLMLTFEFDCGSKFVQVIRHDIEDPKSGKVEIAVGGLIRDNPLSSCAMEKRTVTVPAGSTFSGRQFEITKIRKPGD
jgi:hypothetical protein